MAYQVRLPVFEGPFDLLFHLIESQKINIYDIPIATITEQYLDYLRLLDLLDLEVTTSFLVMAATLLEIKSRMLLPPAPEEELGDEGGGGDDGYDARQPLVDKLVEYRRFKLMALALRERERQASRIFTRQLGVEPQPVEFLQIELSAADLMALYRGLILRRRHPPVHRVVLDRINLSRRIEQLRHELRQRGGVGAFTDLLRDRRNRLEVVVSFLAILEMARLGEIRLDQAGTFRPIHIRIKNEKDDADYDEKVG